MGELDPAFSRADGTDAEFVVMRGIDQNVVERDIVRAGGHLVLVSGRLGAKISRSPSSGTSPEPRTRAWLRGLAAQVLSEFDLRGDRLIIAEPFAAAHRHGVELTTPAELRPHSVEHEGLA